VEFPDLPGSGSPKANYQEMAKGTADYFYKQSRKSLRFEFTTLPSYVSLKSPVTTYKLESYNEVGAYNLLLASLEAVENTLDISDFDLAFVLPPPGVQASQISIGMVYQAYVQSNEFQNATGRILNGIIGGYDSWSDEPSTRWRWMAQVTSFVFGLPAWSNATETGGFGPWDVVSTPWTSEALEWVSWNKYITGWLADSQINCLDLADITATPKSFIIESLGIDSDKSKSVMIPLSDSRILVVEARASAGFDNLPESRTGLLSYVVDISTKYPSSIGKTQAPNGTNTDLRFAVLKEGDSLSVDGIRINAGKRTGDDFEVQISR
jgi:hypothetical protein